MSGCSTSSEPVQVATGGAGRQRERSCSRSLDLSWPVLASLWSSHLAAASPPTRRRRRRRRRPPLPPCHPHSPTTRSARVVRCSRRACGGDDITAHLTTEDGKAWERPLRFGGSVQGPSMAVCRRLQERSCQPAATRMWCLSAIVWWLVVSEVLNGVASAAYNAAEWSNVTATVSADSVRGRGLAFLSELDDVTADGSAVWTRVGSITVTTTYTPATGSRLVNNLTTNVATFGGGSYSVIRSSQATDGTGDLTISRSPLTAPSTH